MHNCQHAAAAASCRQRRRALRKKGRAAPSRRTGQGLQVTVPSISRTTACKHLPTCMSAWSSASSRRRLDTAPCIICSDGQRRREGGKGDREKRWTGWGRKQAGGRKQGEQGVPAAPASSLPPAPPGQDSTPLPQRKPNSTAAPSRPKAPCPPVRNLRSAGWWPLALPQPPPAAGPVAWRPAGPAPAAGPRGRGGGARVCGSSATSRAGRQRLARATMAPAHRGHAP